MKGAGPGCRTGLGLRYAGRGALHLCNPGGCNSARSCLLASDSGLKRIGEGRGDDHPHLPRAAAKPYNSEATYRPDIRSSEIAAAKQSAQRLDMRLRDRHQHRMLSGF